MEAMCGWSPCGLVVDKPRDFLSSSAWVDKLRQHSAAVRDYVEEALSALDSVDAGPQALCPYAVDDLAMIRRPDRRQKCTSPYEPGWRVIDVISPSTVKIAFTNDDGSVGTKLVNVDVLKPQPAE